MRPLRHVLAVLAVLASTVTAGAQAPALQAFEPASGTARGVLVVSGQSGPANYAAIARQIADQGFNVLLVDGNDVLKPNNAGEPAFKAAVAAVMASPKTAPGKIGVVGFSLGGGATLTYATRMPDKVATAVAYYPYTAFIQNPAGFVGLIKVPTLMFAAGKDTYKNCCVITMARSLAAAAKSGGKPLLDVVEYPEAQHGFILKGPTLRATDAADALKRAVAHLRGGLGT